MNKKIINLKQVLLVFLATIILLSNNTFANDTEKKDLQKEIKKGIYTEEYQKYLELSEEEKSNLEIIPRKNNISIEKYLETRASIVKSSTNTNIPTKFDLRDFIEIPVEDQGGYGLCWGFASLNSVETYLALNSNEKYDFSELHLDYLTSNEYKNKMNISSSYYYSRKLHDGGNFSQFYHDYAALGNGPILEVYLPYNAEVSESEYSTLSTYPLDAFVYSIIDFPRVDKESASAKEIEIVRNDIKNHIMTNGSVYAAVNSKSIVQGNNGDFVLNHNDYYSDHAISIIGWDDNYSKENFPLECRPQNDGAYIALNSWGDWWGNNGIFYISYEDYTVDVEISGVTNVSGETFKTKDITFKDKNLYNYFKKEYSSYIRKTDDTTLTISFIDVFVNNLKELYISNISDLSGIENFSSLQVLSINNSSLENIDSLKNMKFLSTLFIGITDIGDWSALSNLSLEYIDFTYTNFSNWALLNNMPLLRTIFILDGINNIDGTLNLEKSNNLESIFIELEEKELSIINLNSKKLELLYLNNVNINPNDLSDAINLAELTLANVKIENLSFITSEFEKLSCITLFNTGIKNINDLKYINTDTRIDITIENNEIIDVSGIQNEENIYLTFLNCYKEENLEELIFKDEFFEISIPDSIKYTINKLKEDEYSSYKLIVKNGTLNDENSIILDTSIVEDNIPLEIALYYAESEDSYDESTIYIKYNIYFNVKDKNNYTEEYARINYTTHVQNIGWQKYVRNGQMAGTSGLSLRLEGIKIKVDGNLEGGIAYTTHVQNIGWQPETVNEINNENPSMSGTLGKSLRLEAIKIRLTGVLAEKYDIYYRVHAQNAGWLGWAKNGEEAGTAGYGFRLESIEIKLVKKDDIAPEQSKDAYLDKVNVIYTTHVQNVGWLPNVSNGQMSGTSGKSLRLEGIKIYLTSTKLKGDILYSTHIQNIGWQEEMKNGEISGTSGKSLRLEAIKIRLTEDFEREYDIYYRVHAQNAGWLGWAKNGEEAGTAGYGFRLEGIEIKVLPKDSIFTGERENCFIQK